MFLEVYSKSSKKGAAMFHATKNLSPKYTCNMFITLQNNTKYWPKVAGAGYS